MYGMDSLKEKLYCLPHTWIVTVMEMYQICPKIIRFVEALIKE
jgi:hypothetical protein